MPQAVFVIWLILLCIIVVAIVPLAIVLLHRTMRNAQAIERYFAEMAEAGTGIVNHVSHAKALEETIQLATAILGVAGNIKQHTATIKETLARRVNT
ncbi:MAG: hypothetical protein ETSY1_21505 [Candidatus Entotheonella factor]|uniref:Uncharacterized protein n=1 Tax=Entotheonella factor TaxID=1429438 RepID=W4LIJ7_ENTF1|nr:MAG: hypothetical protein ETSY1_21505 [Candidatus Entotheonella factor]